MSKIEITIESTNDKETMSRFEGWDDNEDCPDVYDYLVTLDPNIIKRIDILDVEKFGPEKISIDMSSDYFLEIEVGIIEIHHVNAIEIFRMVKNVYAGYAQEFSFQKARKEWICFPFESQGE